MKRGERRMETATILIVEDDAAIAQAMMQRLDSWGFQSVAVRDFKDVVGEFAKSRAHLVIMDVSLPYFDGFYWCRRIRELSKVPILFVSAAADNMNIVMAVNMGADDFVVKPFDLSVLAAKVQALLRRAYDFGTPGDVLFAGGVSLHPDDGTADAPGGRVQLSRNEQRILRVLFENRGRIVSRETLMTRLWESEAFVDENTLSVNVARLRKKLADVGAADLIETKKGEGYLVR